MHFYRGKTKSWRETWLDFNLFQQYFSTLPRRAGLYIYTNFKVGFHLHTDKLICYSTRFIYSKRTTKALYVLTGNFCRCLLLITFANIFDPDQDRQNVGPDLYPKL